MPQAADGIVDSFMQGKESESQQPSRPKRNKEMSAFMLLWDMQK